MAAAINKPARFIKMAHFDPPAIQDNPLGWGPCSVPDKFKDMPYQPFSKGDRLGKVKAPNFYFLPYVTYNKHWLSQKSSPFAEKGHIQIHPAGDIGLETTHRKDSSITQFLETIHGHLKTTRQHLI